MVDLGSKIKVSPEMKARLSSVCKHGGAIRSHIARIISDERN